MEAERLLDGLNESQIEAVICPNGPVVVLAGAGSGKTRVLTRRIAWRVLNGETDPNRVLTLTFTRKAATELRDRQRQLGLRDAIPAGTFHSFALAQLRQRWHERRTVPPTLLVSKIRLLSQLVGRVPGVEIIDVVAELDWARARMIEPEGFESVARNNGRILPMAAGELAEIMVRYQQEKRRKRVVDFDDLLLLAIRDLRADQDYREAVRWRHRHFYVDEFQDVNPLQFALLHEWLGERTDLFIVGDPNQAIYSWNGADPTLLTGLAAEATSTVVELNDNYRSTPQVLSLAGTTLTSDAAAKLQAHQADGPHPTITSYSTDQAEAAGVAQAVYEARSFGGHWSDQAVLVRTNAQLVLIEQALAELRVPNQVRSGPGPLGSPEVRAELKAIGREGIDLIQQLEDLDERLRKPVGEQSGLSLDRHNNLAALSRVIHDYVTTDPLPTGTGLQAWIDTMQRGDIDSKTDAVDLVTFHGSKGLEWSVVHIAGLEEGFVPIVYAKTKAQHMEERRLLYVALTRAEQQLHLSWAMERTFGTQTSKRSPSPLLGALHEAISDLSPTTPAMNNWRTHIEQTREQIPSDPEPAPPMSESVALESLRSWRRQKAKAGGVPPHVILSDQMLKLMASQRPSNTAELAGLPGMRPTKLHRYGDELLATLHGSPASATTQDAHRA